MCMQPILYQFYIHLNNTIKTYTYHVGNDDSLVRQARTSVRNKYFKSRFDILFGLI